MRIEAQRHVGLVVAQVDVVARPVLLDEGVLEEKGLLLGIGDDRLDLPHPVEQKTDLGAAVAAGGKIGPQPGAQVFRLADIENGPVLAFHDVNAAAGGKFFRIDHLRLAIGYRLSAIGYRLSAIGYRLSRLQGLRLNLELGPLASCLLPLASCQHTQAPEIKPDFSGHP